MELKELEKLIRETVRETLSLGSPEPDDQTNNEIQMGGAYRFKEELMQSVQDGLRAESDLIESQDEYEGKVDDEIEKLRQDIDLTLSMIGRALYQVPFQAFKTSKPK